MVGPPERPALRARWERRRRTVVATAARLFAERGYQATSMDEVAARVGVTKPMLYEYFGSKDGLLAACLARARQQLHERTVAAVAAGGEPREVMRCAVLAFFEFVDDHAAAWRVLQAEAMVTSGPGAQGIEEIRRQQSAYTQTLLAAMPGGADLGPVALKVRSEMVTGACERVAVWRTSQPEPPDAEAVTDLVLDALWPGLSVPAR
jgi:AcrR family transcriptional regulator